MELGAGRARRFVVVARRLAWGAGQAGLRRTAAGTLRYLGIRVRRPAVVRCVTPSGLDITLANPSQLMPTLVLFGDLLEPELGMLPLLLGPGATVVDVGAAVGTWTLSAAATGARVHACEPDPQNVASLRANLRVNGMTDRVSVHRIGLGSHEGRGVLLPQKRRYLNRIRTVDKVPAGASAEGAGPPGEDEAFPVQTLDGFAAALGLGAIDIVKINTAGGESDVLQGCRALLRERRVGLFLVLDGLAVRSVLDEAAGQGYELGVWDGPRRRMLTVAGAEALEAAPRGPMNRYVMLRRRPPTERPAPDVGVVQAG